MAQRSKRARHESRLRRENSLLKQQNDILAMKQELAHYRQYQPFVERMWKQAFTTLMAVLATHGPVVVTKGTLEQATETKDTYSLEETTKGSGEYRVFVKAFVEPEIKNEGDGIEFLPVTEETLEQSEPVTDGAPA